MFEKFDWMLARYQELSEAVSQPEIIADQARWQRLLKEHAALEPAVEAYRAYQKTLSDLAEAREMLSQPDMAELAQDEVNRLEAEKQRQEYELRLLLLPKDPDADKNVVMEIRQGAGGDEAALFGALLFVLTGDIPNYIDALFETISGLTTTGASVVTAPEEMTRGGMFWRLFTHWIGGMGILVFVLAVLPMSGNRSMHIMRAEVPGPTVGKLVPRIRKTASILYLLYIALTLVEMVLLIAGGMSFYDALLHAFATAGTGGLSTRALSIGYYNSAYIDIVVGVFMILFGVNFSLYYLILLGNIRTALRNEELRWFLGVIAFSVLTIAFDIRNLYGGVGHALRYSFFQVTSIISTTGFATADFNLWPEYSKFLLVLLMFVGGCAGSTAGGLKVSRVMLLFKSCTIEVKKMLRPRCIEEVRLDGKSVDGQTVYNALTYFTFYIIILLIAGLIVSLDGLDFTTNFTAALSCLSNVGPGLSLVGPTGSFAIFSPLSKIVLMICMLLGRLEIFPLLLLFVPFTWRWK